MTETYAPILAGLTRRRDELEAELASVNAAIANILPLAAGENPGYMPKIVSRPSQPPGHSGIVGPHFDTMAAQTKVGNYSQISVRWAALWHLAEFATGPMRNGEIADAILTGGYRSGAGSFPNAVSAVLSGMRQKGEIDGSPDTGYSLTDFGRHIWETIRRSERFKSSVGASLPSGQSLLSTQ